jgi:hypothetical protein
MVIVPSLKRASGKRLYVCVRETWLILLEEGRRSGTILPRLLSQFDFVILLPVCFPHVGQQKSCRHKGFDVCDI